MKISLNWLADYIDVATKLDEVLEKLTLRGLEVESITDLSRGFEKVFVAQVQGKEKHPNADRLSVCQVFDGKMVRQIVCGAQNFKSGDKVCLAVEGARLPDGTEIKKSRIRDVESEGMLCSETELGLATQSQGILVLPDEALLGENLGKFLGRDDVIFEINVTPNRGDVLSFVGVARELAAILGQTVKPPLITGLESSEPLNGRHVVISIEDEALGRNLCLQYHARTIEGVKIEPSPDWLQRRLKSIGLRPVNNVVDITNFVLMEWGTPLHAFDYDKIQDGQIKVRLARPNEKIYLLDKTEVTLTDQDLVIADANKPIALAGVMGGGNSEVTGSTVNLLLEAAQFLPSCIQASSKRHQKKTDSSHRFERQIDASAVRLASNRATELILKYAGGQACQQSRVYSPQGEQTKTAIEKTGFTHTVKIDLVFLCQFLGIEISAHTFEKALKSIGFSTQGNGSLVYVVGIPSYRPDVLIKEDVAEEVLRVIGYDKVEGVVPRLQFIPEALSRVDQRVHLIEKLKNAFVMHGFLETVNYAFTSRFLNEKWSLKAESDQAVELANPLSEEFSTLKTSLVGGLVSNYVTAIHNQISTVRLFEVRPVFFKDETSETGVREEWRVVALISGLAHTHGLKAHDREVDFYDLKGVFESVADAVGVRGIRYEIDESGKASESRYHPGQIVKIVIGRGMCGVIARLHPKLETEMKAPVYVLEFDLDKALEHVTCEKQYSPISKFPKVQRDFSFIVQDSTSAGVVLSAVQKFGKPLVESAQIVDLYRGDKIPQGTYSLSIALVFSDPTRTLEDSEVEASASKILSGLDKDIGATLRIK